LHPLRRTRFAIASSRSCMPLCYRHEEVRELMYTARHHAAGRALARAVKGGGRLWRWLTLTSFGRRTFTLLLLSSGWVARSPSPRQLGESLGRLGPATIGRPDGQGPGGCHDTGIAARGPEAVARLQERDRGDGAGSSPTWRLFPQCGGGPRHLHNIYIAACGGRPGHRDDGSTGIDKLGFCAQISNTRRGHALADDRRAPCGNE